MEAMNHKMNNSLPQDTFKFISDKHVTCDNLLLSINKFSLDKELKHSARTNYKSNIKQYYDFVVKYRAMLENIPGIDMSIIYIKPTWRFIVGLGNPSVYETSLTLQHIYGFPIIPGQAIKGVVRNFVIKEFYNSDEKSALKCPKFYNIFGNQDRIGKVTFFDSYPITEPFFDFDIMNPHFVDYYSDKKPPTDDQKPRPIKFINIVGEKKAGNNESKQSIFMLAFGVTNNSEVECNYPKVKNLKELITMALSEYGLGAKTSSGYGLFKETIKDPEFDKRYYNYNKKLIQKREDQKPKYQKIIDKIKSNTKIAEEFLKDNANKESERTQVEAALKDFYCDDTVWASRKLNGQIHEFVKQAYNFFLSTDKRYNEILSKVIKHASKKQRKKFKA